MKSAAFVCVMIALTFAAVASGGEISWLRSDGARIVNERGETVVLRGYNLGGWLVEEMWMMPFFTKPPEGSEFKEIRDHASLWATVEKRFGAKEMIRVRAALRNAWITEADFDRLRELGLNCLRVPFLYELLDEPDGFSWLDKALDWARQRGMYVILDLHGAPGRQSKDHHTGEEGVNRLFRSEASIQQTEAVWRRIAARYRNRPEVAAYDLLNEPMGAPNNKRLYDVYDRLYRAVRAEDPRRLIIIEDGYRGIQHMPIPAERDWQNVVLSVHSYKFDAKSEQDHHRHLQWLVSTVEQAQRERNAPFYLGEFNLEPHGKPATMAAFLKALEERRWSWTIWTYKVAGGNGGRSLWGLYYYAKPPPKLDPFGGSPEQMLQTIERWRTENFSRHNSLAAVLASVAP